MKKLLILLFLALAGINEVALADNTALPNVIENLGEKKVPDLIKVMEDKEKEVRAKLKEATEQGEPEPSTSLPIRSETSEKVLKLMDEVEKLKTKVVLTKENALATQNPRSRTKVGSKTYYTYKDGEIYEIHAGVDRVTDIELQPGEELSNVPVTGDSVRWKVSVIKSGTSEGPVTHLILKPIEENIETNIILTTQRRTYHLRALSGDFYMPSVAWNYPEDERKQIELQKINQEKSETLGIIPENLEFGYEISENSYKWSPIRVFDDGAKTFIQMKPEISSSEAPALFVIEEDGEPQLVNYRVKGSYYIVDRIFDRAELRVGPKMKVDITSKSYRPTFWERVF